MIHCCAAATQFRWGRDESPSLFSESDQWREKGLLCSILYFPNEDWAAEFSPTFETSLAAVAASDVEDL